MAAGVHDLPEDEAAAAVVHVNPEELVSGEVDAALEHLLGHVNGVEFDQKLDNVGKDVGLCSDRILFALESDLVIRRII